MIKTFNDHHFDDELERIAIKFIEYIYEKMDEIDNNGIEPLYFINIDDFEYSYNDEKYFTITNSEDQIKVVYYSNSQRKYRQQVRNLRQN